MQATTSYKERIGVFEKFLESIDKFNFILIIFKIGP